MRPRVLVLVAALGLALPAAADAKTGNVYFTRGEQIAAVKRTAAPAPVVAVKALLPGPTARERRAGYGTLLPAGMTLISSKETGGTVSLTFSGTADTADEAYLARVAQVVYTATAVVSSGSGCEGRPSPARTLPRPSRAPSDLTSDVADKPIESASVKA